MHTPIYLKTTEAVNLSDWSLAENLGRKYSLHPAARTSIRTKAWIMRENETDLMKASRKLNRFGDVLFERLVF